MPALYLRRAHKRSVRLGASPQQARSDHWAVDVGTSGNNTREGYVGE
jgi:hypothetical protein